LKRLSCVSFAGVDSLDDVKNHTYNELFVSGGFVVSDESVLNPESLTTGKCDTFWSFKIRTKKDENLVWERCHTHRSEESSLLSIFCGFCGLFCFETSANSVSFLSQWPFWRTCFWGTCELGDLVFLFVLDCVVTYMAPFIPYYSIRKYARKKTLKIYIFSLFLYLKLNS